jgi:PhzF family phenazine biosynthesis protein
VAVKSHGFEIGNSKMTIPLYQVDAFTDRVFSGNPAAVCPLEHWLDDSVLQNIAAENNLAETAFFVKASEGFHIRWFTPKAEVDLCGHATVATAHVMFNLMGHVGRAISFQSRSGILTVTKDEEWFILNFPTDTIEKIEITTELSALVDRPMLEAYRGRSDFMFVFGTRRDVERLKPDLHRMGQLGARGVIVTAQGTDSDVVSRFFAPGVGIDEDPATGSAHTTLAPYWSARLGKTELIARQISERGGYFKCKLLGDRVEISGKAALYMRGQISI